MYWANPDWIRRNHVTLSDAIRIDVTKVCFRTAAVMEGKGVATGPLEKRSEQGVKGVQLSVGHFLLECGAASTMPSRGCSSALILLSALPLALNLWHPQATDFPCPPASLTARSLIPPLKTHGDWTQGRTTQWTQLQFPLLSWGPSLGRLRGGLDFDDVFQPTLNLPLPLPLPLPQPRTSLTLTIKLTF